MATTIAVRTKKERKADVVAFSEAAIRQNAAVLDYCRTSMVALAGCTAGIMGLTGLYGFVFYFVMTMLLSVMLLIKAGSNSHLYFRSKLSLLTGGVMGGLFTYVLFWTFLYGMVHVY